MVLGSRRVESFMELQMHTTEHKRDNFSYISPCCYRYKLLLINGGYPLCRSCKVLGEAIATGKAVARTASNAILTLIFTLFLEAVPKEKTYEDI